MKYFTADTHFAWPKILEITARPFKRASEHDHAILENINKVVGESDELYVLGDFCHHDVAYYRHRIACEKVTLILGNHDEEGTTTVWQFENCQHTMPVEIEKQLVWLSHYPHAFWPDSFRGSFHLYGHVHSQREETLDAIWPERRSMDIGLDNAFRLLGEYRPFSEFEIMTYLGMREGHDPLSFYQSLEL